MPLEAPRAVDPPDAPEASNWIRGSFDSQPGSEPSNRNRHRTNCPPAHPPATRRVLPGVTDVTATLIGQQKITRTHGLEGTVATLDRAVPALLVENVTKRFV